MKFYFRNMRYFRKFVSDCSLLTLHYRER